MRADTSLDALVHVFVYGTLMADEINDIRGAAARAGLREPYCVGRACVPGRLVDFGDYPGLIVGAAGLSQQASDQTSETPVPSDTNTPVVVGEVYRIDTALLPVLDEIEEIATDGESLFIRQRLTVQVDGIALECFFYPIQERLAGVCGAIASGDWIAHRSKRP
ncbi:MAG: gamma-glutamylcyclotransferase family protein [Janthinobacterium lividum]